MSRAGSTDTLKLIRENRVSRSGQPNFMQLDQFSGQSFEQLIQALAAQKFGAGVTVFGPGRDGGREAIFRGRLPSFEARDWDGYVVMQAKCKERPHNDDRDASWLCNQLKGDLQKFIDDPTLDRPEYYLLCSNVQLSAVPKVGGKAKVDDVFKEFAAELKLKDWHVWTADEIKALLADAPSIRQTFASWITPGDILTEMMERLVGPDVKKTMPVVLSRDIRADRDARLRDAGQETEQAVFLEKVFIDLPVELPIEIRYGDVNFEEVREISDEELALFAHESDFDELDVEYGSFEETPDHCVASLFKLAADKLDPIAVDAHRQNRRGALRNRVVILGGPGQGKSTLGQFVVQLARARLLAAAPQSNLAHDIRTAIDHIKSAAEKLDIPLSGPTRFPIRIDLPLLADAMSNSSSGITNIIDFVAKKFGENSSQPTSASSIHKIIKEFPCVVIFDGLDEVPPSANRKEVIAAIDGFWDDVHSVGGDVLCVVTSRPQGYDNDLSSELWQHWNLLPLHPRNALDYAQKLGDIRLSEPERKERILTDIRNACSDPATALLTTSPLQVTILFGISFLKGSIPQDRWELFDRYYNLLREREAQKPGDTSKFIREHKRIIDDLHQTCGWVLQAEAEAPGRTVSFLSNEQFRKIVVDLLAEEGHEGDPLLELSDRLATIATDRLVLLATRTEGQVSFDVRSLQEYMAAAKLVGSDHPVLVDRLKTIAPSAHWRHVFRIAANKIFSVAEMGHLRADVVSICDALDKGDLQQNAMFVGAGAKLALDLLADGISANAPKFHKSLLMRAITLLDRGDDTFDVKASSAFAREKSDTFLDELEVRINADKISAARNAVACLLVMPSSSKTSRLLDHFFGMKPDKIMRVLATIDAQIIPKKYRKSIEVAQQEAGELLCLRAMPHMTMNEADNVKIGSRGPFALPPLSLQGIGVLTVGVSERLAVRVPSLQWSHDYYSSAPGNFNSAKWPIFEASRKFAVNPGPEALADAVASLANVGNAALAEARQFAPWPLQLLINDMREGHEARLLAEKSMNGDFGDKHDWLKAEARWRGEEAGLADYLSFDDGFYAGKTMGISGLPPMNRVTIEQRPGLSGTALMKAAEKLDGPKFELVLWLITMTLMRPAEPKIDQHTLNGLLELYFDGRTQEASSSGRRKRLFSLGSAIWSDVRVIEFANLLGLNNQTVTVALPLLLKILIDQPHLRGLLAHVRSSAPGSARSLKLALPEEILAINQDDSDAVKAGIILLRLHMDEIDDLDLSSAAEILTGNQNLANDAAKLIKVIRQPEDPVTSEFAYQLAQHTRLSGKEPRGSLVDLLSAAVSASPTDLGTAEKSASLGLPCLSRS